MLYAHSVVVCNHGAVNPAYTHISSADAHANIVGMMFDTLTQINMTLSYLIYWIIMVFLVPTTGLKSE